MSSSLDVWFTDSDFLLLTGGRQRKQPAKILFHNIRHHSWQPWAGFTGRRKSLFPLSVPQQRHPTHTHLCATRWRAERGEEKGGMAGWGQAGMEGWREGSEKQAWLQGGEPSEYCVIEPKYSALQLRSSKCVRNKSFLRKHTPARTRARRRCNRKNTIICFSLLRNLLSAVQPCSPPPPLSLSPPLQRFLQFKL